MAVFLLILILLAAQPSDAADPTPEQEAEARQKFEIYIACRATTIEELQNHGMTSKEIAEIMVKTAVERYKHCKRLTF